MVCALYPGLLDLPEQLASWVDSDRERNGQVAMPAGPHRSRRRGQVFRRAGQPHDGAASRGGRSMGLITRRLGLTVALCLSAHATLAANCHAPVVDGQLYSVVNAGSGKALDVVGGSQQAGAAMQQWGYTAGAHQQFTLRNLGNGYWSMTGRASGMLLDIDLASVSDGAGLLQWPGNGGLNQQWLLKQALNGAYNVQARHSGKSLTAPNSNSGARIYQAADGATGFQRWFFNPASGSCGAAPDGFAGQRGPDGLATTTGGGSTPPVLVTSCSALIAALQSSQPAVVQIPAGAAIDCRTAPRTVSACAVACPSNQDPGKYTYRLPVGAQSCKELGASSETRYSRTRNEQRIFVGSNKTLVGLDRHATLRGASLELGASRNVIIRNLSIEQINPALVEGGDGITLSGASHVWVDHVRFSMISDGHIDIANSSNVTLSWNRFDGVNPAVCGSKHFYTNAIVNSQVTLHHNFWDRSAGRNPKLDGLATRAHLYNNYWRDISYFAINAAGGAQARIEGNFFANTSRPHWNAGGGLLEAALPSNRYTGIAAADPYRHTGAAVFGDTSLAPYKLDNVDGLPAVLDGGTGPR
jgi:pectate lyase